VLDLLGADAWVHVRQRHAQCYNLLMAAARPFSDLYLREYSGEHLLYEYWMLIRCAELLANQHKHIQCAVEDTETITNVLVESFAIHLRNLITFFYGDSKRYRPTDVLAIDYFDDGRWNNLRPPKSELITRAEDQASKQIAHLTTKRYAGVHEEKKWHFLSLSKEVRNVTRIFIGGASASRLAPSFRNT